MTKHVYELFDNDDGEMMMSSDKLTDITVPLREEMMYIPHGNYIRSKLLEDGSIILECCSKRDTACRYNMTITIRRWVE